ncbi:MAG: hypothetical protein JWQ43_1079 [Glaciihabitans sp.]|nr:hypothetical protein [Glaciihabitans sp.]
MPVFPRRKRVNLGSFAAPPPVAPSPAQRIIDEGLLITTSAVRMVVKNDLIIRALRHEANFDPLALAETARNELVHVAGQNDEYADRLAKQLENAPAITPALMNLTGDAELVSVDQGRRVELYRLLAEALRGISGDDDLVEEIITGARDDALREIGGAIKSKLLSPDVDPGKEAHYSLSREKRMRTLVEQDLALLAEQHNVTLDLPQREPEPESEPTPAKAAKSSAKLAKKAAKKIARKLARKGAKKAAKEAAKTGEVDAVNPTPPAPADPARGASTGSASFTVAEASEEASGTPHGRWFRRP